MAFEFVARNGIIALNNTQITGSLNVSGSIVVSGSVINTLTASFAVSASQALTASYVFASGVVGLNLSQIASGSVTASVDPTYGFRVNSNSSITGSLRISGSVTNSSSLAVIGTGSGVFTVDGTSGRLFSVDDSLSGSLFSVNTAAGLPVMEAFSDNTVRIGKYGIKAFFVSQSAIGINKETALNGVLDISGSAVITGSLIITGSTNVIGDVTGSNARFSGTITTQTLVVQTVSSSITYSSGSNIFGNSLANTQVLTGSVTITGSLSVNGQTTLAGAVTAASAIARGANLTSTLVAAANSDVLVGLDINPTFTNGAFSSVINNTLRVSGVANFLGSVGINNSAPTEKLQIDSGNIVLVSGKYRMYNTGHGAYIDQSYTGDGYLLELQGTKYLTVFRTTGNLVLQNGGTFTDAGYRLDVSGSTRLNGNTQITGSLNVSGSITTTGTITAQTLVVQTITSSIEYSSGSNIFGSQITNTQTFTGSVLVTGSITVATPVVNNLTASYALTASLAQQVSTSISTQNLQHNVLFVDTTGPGFIQVDGGLRYNPNQDLLTTTSSYAIQAATATSASFATNVIPITSKTMIIGNNNYIQPYDTGSFVFWRVPYPITASSITAFSTSSLGPTSGSQVSANKNGSLLLAVPLAVTTSTWVSSSALQNQYFNTGDVLGFNFLTLTGSLTQIVIQVDFIK
jgi:hypothetical protein